MADDDVTLGFVLRTIAVFLGMALFLAGATNLAATLFFDSPAAGADPRWNLWGSVLVMLLGALIAGAPLARTTRELWDVRKRERELDADDE